MSSSRPGSGWGTVYLVGAGPGDPGLLTRRGAELLARADVVVYDHLASARLLDLAPASALRVCAGKSIGHCTLSQGEINRELAAQARRGRTVVRLKGGDPFVFGRGAEEAEHLRAEGVAFEVVPGVTAGVGVTAYAGVPVTHRGVASAVAFVTGHDDPESGRLDWSALAKFPGTLVVYMGVTNLERLCRALVKHGKPAETPAALIESGTLASQRTVTATLADLPAEAAGRGFGPPALLVVGSAVGRRESLRWFEARPLFGQRVVVTRPADDADRSAATLEALGAEVLIAPTVTLGPPADWSAADRAIGRLDRFDWLVFTSAHGVRGFLDRLESTGRDLRALGGLRIAAVGPGTAEALARYRLKADLVPAEYGSEALAAALAGRAAGGRLLLARADRGRPLLRDELARVAEVEEVTVYRHADAAELPEAVATRLAEGTVDWVTLTSPAVTERLATLLPEAARARVGSGLRLASISPLTTAAAGRLGWPVAAEAAAATWDGLVEALAARVAADRERGPDT